MMTRKNNEVAQKLDSIMTMLESMDSRISALEVAKATSTKAATTKKTITNKSTKATKSAKTTSKVSTPVKTSAKKTAPKTEVKDTKVVTSTALKDFEPCKFKDSDNYVWGGSKGYKAMRSAYCYAKQTGGKARNLEEARKLGVQIDFDKAWAKAKAEFEKKYHYVKAADRA